MARPVIESFHGRFGNEKVVYPRPRCRYNYLWSALFIGATLFVSKTPGSNDPPSKLEGVKWRAAIKYLGFRGTCVNRLPSRVNGTDLRVEAEEDSFAAITKLCASTRARNDAFKFSTRAVVSGFPWREVLSHR